MASGLTSYSGAAECPGRYLRRHGATRAEACCVVEMAARLARAVRFLAGEAGIRQFPDIGTGIPTAGYLSISHPASHEVHETFSVWVGVARK
jgi:hypothetical protein